MRILKKISPLISCFAVLIIFSILFKINGIYPFGNLSISWCDMDQQTIPLLCVFKDVLSGKSDFWLSLENAGGMNFYGVYFFNLSSPFTYLILFYDKVEIPLAVNLMVILKLAFSALTFSIWLKRVSEKANPIAIISLSLLYAFSGYTMMYYQILSWLDTVYLFPILLIGLDNLTKDKSPLIFILSLFACILCHFYLGYAVVVFICLFGATFLFAYKQNRVIFAKKLLISSVISALLSTVVLIPVFLQYLNSMRGGSIFLSLWQSSFFPPIETSLPTFLSLFIVLPFALNFCLKKNLDHLEILFILTLIPVFIEPIAAAWQTYDYMSFPTRYGFITIALGLTLALRGITNLCEKEDEIKDKNRWLLYLSGIIVTLFCVGFSFFTYNYFAKNKEVLSVYTRSLWGNKDSLIKLFIYYLVPLAFVLLVYCAKRYKLVHKIAVYALIGVLIVIECFFSASVYIVSPSNDYANFSRAFELENVIEDDDFYRVKCNAKNFDVNLVGALGYNSLSHYTSLNRESYMMAIKELGYSSYWMETHSNGGTIFTDALLRNKYTVYLGKKSNADLSTEHFYVMKNDLLFPTAFIIEKNGQNQSDQTLARWQIQDDFFTRLTGKQGLYTPYSITEYSNVKDESTQQQTKLTLTSSSAFVEYNFLVSGTQAVYFDCFNVYSNSLKEETYEAVSSVTVTANNRSTKYYSYPTSNKNGTFYLGTFTNTQVKVKIILNKDINYTSFGVFSVDSDLLKNAVNELIAGDFTVEKDFLSGKIIADSNTQALFTSFAYDEGYRAKVNGKKANVFSLNGFLAIELEEGENFVEVDFLPKGFVLSFVIFAFGVCIFILYIVYEKKINAFLEDKKIINKLFVFLTYALGIIVVIMIYLMPVCVNLISYFNYYFL